jgi:hypothetical protein
MMETAYVTPHAVERFRARIDPDLDETSARAAILRGLETDTASVVPAHSGRGVVVRVRRRSQPYSFRALIGPGDGPLPAVVTILQSGH